MPVSLPNLHHHYNCLTLTHSPPLRPRRASLSHPNPKRFNLVFAPQSHRFAHLNTPTSRISISPPNSVSSVNGFAGEGFAKEREWSLGFRRWIEVLRSVLPGGRWWELPDRVEVVDDVKPVTVFSALERMWDLIAQDRWVVFVAFVALIVAALSEISIPHYLTASVFSAQSGEAMVFRRNAQLLILFCVASGIASGVRGCCFSIANMILVKRMREKLYSSLLFQDISFFDSETVGDLTSRLGSDCQQVSRVIGNDLNMIFRNVLQGTGALVYLFILSWPLALSTLATCFLLAFVILLHGQYQKKAAKLTQEFTAYANEVAQETLSLIRTVRAHGTEKQELGRFDQWLKNLADISLRQSVAYGIWNFSYNNLYHSTQVVAVLIGGASIVAGHITAEQLTKYILYCEWLIYATWWVGDNLSSLMQAVGASEKVFRLMDLLPGEQFLVEGVKLQRLLGRIDFVDVSFHYPSRTMVHVLQRVNLSIFPNEVVALVGLSGSGKSTFVNLLLRFYEPTDGKLLIDGFPLKDLDIKWFRENIGYVGQEPRLFRMDVGSNIRYGCPKDVNQEDVELAAKQAYAHDFILSLPNGYQTIVDDDLLSGGQKQRIAIARALLRDPSILILDEATSALDAESEHNIKGVILSVNENSKKKRTVIVIAHRLSTIQAANRIVVLDGGQIVEMGRHSELLKKGGLYARLTQRQADAFA